MGSLQASEMARLTDLDTALSWHLQSNHYPPVPLSMIGPCKRAIIAYRKDDTDREIRLPKGVRYRGKTTAPAWAVVGAHHLEPFVTEEDN